MTIQFSCHANCDDVLLLWEPADGKPIAQCLGYAVEVRDADHPDQVEALHNLKGFAQDHPQQGQTQPSTQWPLQTNCWLDHTALIAPRVQFRVTAMVGQPGRLQRGDDSGWSQVVALSSSAGPSTNAFFNRGMIMSQFVTRYAKQNNITSVKALKSALTSAVNGPLMQFLCGELGKAVRGLLQQAQQDASIELYCALFELDLDDLVEGLIAVGARAHVILANGSPGSDGDDENAAVAARLAGKVDLHRRMCAPRGLGHNKFVVVCKNGQPFGVWTGSTNWTMTGLHTQINNGLAVTDADLATCYLDQWHAIAKAGDAFTPQLKSGNASAHGPFALGGAPSARLWFTPQPAAHGGQAGGDIEDLIALVQGAQEGILFVMFMPGQEPLDTILKRQEGGLYVRGVVSTLPMGTKDNASPTCQIMNGAGYKQYKLDVIQPYGADAVGDFVSTFTRQDFLGGMGFAITHSKVIVIDPFGAHPVVVTGSHNLSTSASMKNDENLLIIRDCPELARAYAVNCMSVYRHYRWPAYQHDVAGGAQAGQAKPGADDGYLVTSDAWQKQTTGKDRSDDLRFWMRN